MNRYRTVRRSVKDLYNAEGQLVKALPKMAKPQHPQLQQAFTRHLEKPRGHWHGWRKSSTRWAASPKERSARAMEGLIEEGKEMIGADAEPDVR